MITKEAIQKVIEQSVLTCIKMGNQTTVLHATLPNGFEIVTTAGTLDPSRFDLEIGKKFCLERLESKLWELEGYVLQGLIRGDNIGYTE